MLFTNFVLKIMQIEVIIFSFLHYTNAYRMFQRRIPNGNIVPHPCNQTQIWHGVGHMVPQGSGPRNDFGWDFRRNGFRWTRALCLKDSDGDGVTNGEELGDPNCTWMADSPTVLPKPKSHPGFCEIFNSPKCANLQDNHNTNPKCDQQQGFKCDGIKEPGVTKVTYKIPRFEIPAVDTTYRCIIYDAPSDKQYHTVGSYQSLDSELLHHISMLGCYDDGSLPPVNTVFPCQLMAPPICSFIGGYTPGMQGQCATGPYGYLLGPKGYKKIYLQFHYNNPGKLTGQFDNSGMDLYYTSNLRKYSAGTVLIRGMYFSIPPRQPSYNVSASCASDCTQAYLDGEMNVFHGLNHMHLYGQKQKTEVIRNGRSVAVIAQDDNYEYNLPVVHSHDANPIRVQRGDEIRTTCWYNTERTAQRIKWGLSTQDEMCSAFVTFYPRENWKTDACLNYKTIPMCQIKATGRYNGCDFRSFLKNIKSSPRVRHLLQICESSTECTSRCFHYLSRLRQHRCLQSEILDLFKSNSNAFNDKHYQRFFSAFIKCNIN